MINRIHRPPRTVYRIHGIVSFFSGRKLEEARSAIPIPMVRRNSKPRNLRNFPGGKRERNSVLCGNGEFPAVFHGQYRFVCKHLSRENNIQQSHFRFVRTRSTSVSFTDHATAYRFLRGQRPLDSNDFNTRLVCKNKSTDCLLNISSEGFLLPRPRPRRLMSPPSIFLRTYV